MTTPSPSRLRELMEKATAGPWFTAVRRADGLTTIEDGREHGLHSFHLEAHDARLVVALVNNAPALLSALDQVEELREALEKIAIGVSPSNAMQVFSDEANATGDPEVRYVSIREFARTALHLKQTTETGR